MEEWYLLRCKPRQDKRAIGNLTSQGLTCYSPKIPVNKSSSMIPISVLEPLFPGYIFIKLNQEANWTAIRSTRGVLSFIKFGIYPAVVPSEIIRKIVKDINEKKSRTLDVKFPLGASVRVVQGCFEGLEAIYKCKLGAERSIILIRMINKMTEVNIENTALEQSR